MWRKQEQPKSPSPATEVAVGPPLGAPNTSSTPSAPNQIDANPPALPTPSSPAPRAPAAGSHLTGSLRIKGEIAGKEDLLVDAQFEGQIHLDGKVIVGPNGRVTANVEAGEIAVAGQVKGSLRGHQWVRIGPTGRMHGEIVSPRVSIEAGAEVDGSVEVTRAAQSPAPRAVPAAGAQAAAPRTVQSVPSVQPPAKEPSAAA